MLKIIASLSLVTASNLPSTTGNFFYSTINAGSVRQPQLKSVHSVDTLIGSSKQKFSLTLSPDLQALTVFKKGAGNASILSNTYYDPAASTTSLVDAGSEATTIAQINYLGSASTDDLYHLTTSVIHGTKYTDNVYFTVDQYYRETSMKMKINVVDIADSQLTYEFDGMIGIAPSQLVDSNYGNLGPDVGFLDQLKALNKVTYKVVALYISNNILGNNSIAKFGSWDQSAIVANSNLQMFESFESDSWGLDANDYTYDGQQIIQQGVVRQIKLDPSVPYMYLPSEDWNNFASTFSNVQNNAKCHETPEPSYCKFDFSCDSIYSDLHQDLSIRVYDLQGTMNFNVDFNDLLIPGNFMGLDDSKCIVGVFKVKPNGVSASATEWFLGSAFMDKYYTVFDNTNYGGSNEKPQIGLGLKNENVVMFKNQYDNSPENTGFSWQQGDQSYSTLSQGGLVKPIDITTPVNGDVPTAIQVVRTQNVVPVAISIPKPSGGGGGDVDGGQSSTFQKLKPYIFGITGILVLALIILLIVWYCKKKKQYGGSHGLFSDEHVALGKKYIN